ncbi:class F sortase [Streptomyces sp. NPDC093094]|uniref:class F sortase n=1 Tax=Streptomyces sp. NPDC093094 TaxID=3366026 RepID=UPI0038268BBE
MTALSRRAFAAAGAAVLLAGCGGQGGADGSRDRASGPGTSSGTPPGAGTPSGRAAPGRADASAGAGARPLGRSEPVRLRIPAAGVDTPLIRLGLAADGTVEVPPVTAHDRAGWYRHSPTPGQLGPSVVLGHVTVGDHGDGVFRRLARLRREDRIEVRLADGVTAVFAVREVRTVAKAEFPVDDVYGDVSRPELRLITCGGPRTDDEYRDNVIVFAVLVSSAA